MRIGVLIAFIFSSISLNAQITKEQLCLCGAGEYLRMTSVAPIKWECTLLPVSTISYNQATNEISFTDQNSGNTTLDLSDLSQTLSITGDQLTIDGENTITLPADVPQTISLVTDQLTLSDGGGTVTLPSGGGTDNQVLSIVPTQDSISISNGNTVKLPSTGGGCETYFVGDALIRASGLGVTYTLSGNVGIVTVPAGVCLQYVRINATTASIAPFNEFTIRIIDNNGGVNQGTFNTFMPPSATSFIERSINQVLDPPALATPFKYTVDAPPTPQTQITSYGANAIDITFKNVDSYVLWTVVAGF